MRYKTKKNNKYFKLKIKKKNRSKFLLKKFNYKKLKYKYLQQTQMFKLLKITNNKLKNINILLMSLN